MTESSFSWFSLILTTIVSRKARFGSLIEAKKLQNTNRINTIIKTIIIVLCLSRNLQEYSMSGSNIRPNMKHLQDKDEV